MRRNFYNEELERLHAAVDLIGDFIAFYGEQEGDVRSLSEGCYTLMGCIADRIEKIDTALRPG